jgi:fructose-1,6-bisphosphatase/inositol monophosphatase family enzyme
MGVAADLKADSSPVTVADESINQLVIDRITAQYPDHGVIGEEGSVERPYSSHQWVCDPIDGTIPYTLGIPTNVFCLALVEAGAPIVSAVFDPYMDRMFTATLGGGAFRDGERIWVSDTEVLEESVMNVAGRSTGMAAALGGPIYADLEQIGVRLLDHSSFVYETVLVAAGMFDAAVFTKRTPWDAAAGALLVTEAGGVASDVAGSPQRYDGAINGAIFSNGKIHAELQAVVAEHLIP